MTDKVAGPDGSALSEGLGVMSAEGIRRALIARLQAADGRCGDVYLAHTDGIVRGLLWALTGIDQGTELTRDVANVLDLAGIPYMRETDGRLTPDGLGQL